MHSVSQGTLCICYLRKMTGKYFDINEEGHSIKCKIYLGESKSPEKLVLFLHGFGGHKDNKAAEKYAERQISKHKNTALVTFNWPSHGDDVKKRLSLADCYSYLRIVTDYIKAQYAPEKLFVYATSFGGYVCLNYINANGSPFDKIAMRGPAINMYDSFTRRIMKNDDMEKLLKGKDVDIGFDRKVRVNKDFLDAVEKADVTAMDFMPFAEDMLIISGRKDEIIPFDVVEKFCDDNVIELVPVENADHRFTNPRCMDSAIAALMEFYGF